MALSPSCSLCTADSTFSWRPHQYWSRLARGSSAHQCRISSCPFVARTVDWGSINLVASLIKVSCSSEYCRPTLISLGLRFMQLLHYTFFIPVTLLCFSFSCWSGPWKQGCPLANFGGTYSRTNLYQARSTFLQYLGIASQCTWSSEFSPSIISECPW